jgi:hypothetical protein
LQLILHWEYVFWLLSFFNLDNEKWRSQMHFFGEQIISVVFLLVFGGTDCKVNSRALVNRSIIHLILILCEKELKKLIMWRRKNWRRKNLIIICCCLDSCKFLELINYASSLQILLIKNLKFKWELVFIIYKKLKPKQ